MFKCLLVDVPCSVSCLKAFTSCFFRLFFCVCSCACVCVCVCPAVCTVFDQHTNKLEKSTAESLLFGPRGTEARYCVEQSGVKTHRSIPRCFPAVRFAVGEINICGLRSGFSSLSWPFHLSSSYCALVYSTAQKSDSFSTIFEFRHFSWLLCTDSRDSCGSQEYIYLLISPLFLYDCLQNKSVSHFYYEP